MYNEGNAWLMAPDFQLVHLKLKRSGMMNRQWIGSEHGVQPACASVVYYELSWLVLCGWERGVGFECSDELSWLTI